MMRQPLTLELASKALHDIVSRQSELTVEQIVKAVADFYRMDQETLISRAAVKKYLPPGKWPCTWARKKRGFAAQIGEILGGRDHTTIMHGWERIASTIEQDDASAEKCWPSER
jgi:chromosomal replication initiator protein